MQDRLTIDIQFMEGQSLGIRIMIRAESRSGAWLLGMHFERELLFDIENLLPKFIQRAAIKIQQERPAFNIGGCEIILKDGFENKAVLQYLPEPKKYFQKESFKIK